MIDISINPGQLAAFTKLREVLESGHCNSQQAWNAITMVAHQLGGPQAGIAANRMPAERLPVYLLALMVTQSARLPAPVVGAAADMGGVGVSVGQSWSEDYDIAAQPPIAVITAAAPQAGGAVPDSCALVPRNISDEICDALRACGLDHISFSETWDRLISAAELAATPTTQAQPANSAVREVTDAEIDALGQANATRVDNPAMGARGIECQLVFTEADFRQAVRAALASLGAGGGV